MISHDVACDDTCMSGCPVAMLDAQSEGGDLGSISGSFVETIRAARQAFSSESVGDLEPLFRARFATYIREKSR